MKEKESKIDVLRLLSVIAVIFLHVNSYAFWNYSTESHWKTANCIESIFIYAVPVFFMISGATLMNYREKYTTKIFFKKRVCRLLFPVLFWMLTGSIYVKLQTGDNWLSAIDVSINRYLWFFVPLCGVYLAMPFLSSIAKNNYLIQYSLLIGFIFSYLLPFLNHAFSIFKGEYSFFELPVGIAGGYFLYAIIGYYFLISEISPKLKYFIYGGSIIGFFIHLLGTQMESAELSKVGMTYKGYLNLPCFLYSVGFFLFLLKDCPIPSFLCEIAYKLRKNLLGVYFIHPFFIDFITQKILTRYHISFVNIYFRLFAPILIFIISITLIYFIKKIPLLKHFI